MLLLTISMLRLINGNFYAQLHNQLTLQYKFWPPIVWSYQNDNSIIINIKHCFIGNSDLVNNSKS